MCICTGEIAEAGNGEVLEVTKQGITIGTRVVLTQYLSLLIQHNSDGQWVLTGAYDIDGSEDIVAEVIVPIQYCPFCGRKLD